MKRSRKPAGRDSLVRLAPFALLVLAAGCGATTAVEIVLSYGEPVKAVRVRGVLDDGTALPEMDQPLPPSGSGSLVLLLPDRLDGRTLALTLDGMTDGGAVGARWTGSIEVVGGHVVRTSAALVGKCGDGLLLAPEECDDGSSDPADGCSAQCAVEDGWSCDRSPSRCVPNEGTCGNGTIEPPEACDDGARDPNDGCSPDCLAEAGFVCFGSPHHCVLESSVEVVDATGPSCPFGTGQGTRDDPFCTLSGAIAATPTGTIVLVAGIYQEKIEISGEMTDLVIAGSGNATLASASPPALKIKQARVRMEALTITGVDGTGGGVRVAMGARVELVGVYAGPSSEIGIDVKDSEVAIERTRIIGNLGGGVRLDGGLHSLASSVIARNGEETSELGGMLVILTSTSSAIINDTFADNRAKPDRTAGVRCAHTTPLVNAIVWNNSGGAATGIDPACLPRFSDLSAAYSGPGAGNISADPIFADDDYHLAPSSPCIDAGDSAAAPSFDLDRDPRPLGTSADIGADEAK